MIRLGKYYYKNFWSIILVKIFHRPTIISVKKAIKFEPIGETTYRRNMIYRNDAHGVARLNRWLDDTLDKHHGDDTGFGLYGGEDEDF